MKYYIDNGNLKNCDNNNYIIELLPYKDISNEEYKYGEINKVFAQSGEIGNTEYISFTIPMNVDNEIKSFKNIFVFNEKVVIYSENYDYISKIISELSSAPKDKNEIAYMVLDKILDDGLILIVDEERKASALECKILLVRHRDLTVDVAKARTRANIIKRYFDSLRRCISHYADSVTADNSETLTNLVNKSEILAENSMYLREQTTQLRESYQTQLDIGQNGTMKVLAIINTIFLPLMLIAGWYGMNIIMPEIDSPYTYPILIGISSLIIIGSLLFFKLKKWW